MKHNFHILRKNTGLNLQNNFIFVDTESHSNKINNKTEVLTFKLGCVIYWNRKSNYKYEKTYYDINDFWNDLEYFILKSTFKEKRKEIILFAHNTQFDFKMLNGFQELFKRNWKLTSFYVRNKTFILIFKKGNLILHIWDTMNYVNKKLEQIGLSVGFPKLEVDFNNVSNKDLEIYCKRDTEIIFQFIKRLLEFLKEYGLSKLKATAGSLSFNIFRHKFYDDKDKYQQIFIHDWKRSIKLERQSYKGGISDCFKIGSYDNLYKTDINSMYASIMRKKKLPFKLIQYTNESEFNQDKLKEMYNKYKKMKFGLIMKVKVFISKENAYILNKFKPLGKSIFAYGIFTLTLCTPELTFIEKNNGKILHIYEMNVYQMKNIYRPFIKFFYNKRIQFREQGNNINADFCKLILLTQYGKWGQKKIIYRQLDKDDDYLIRNQELISLMIERKKHFILQNNIVYLGTIVKECELYIINNKLYFLKQSLENSKESFVAIASFITSYSRMLLIKFLKIAKRENMYYCDTDSLFVNKQGYNNLVKANCLNNSKLGKLKIEATGKGSFYASKFYDFNNERKCKGIKKHSKLIFENDKIVKYQIESWQKLKSDLKISNLNKQIIHTTEKQVRKYYDKGNVINGVVFPFHILENEIILN